MTKFTLTFEADSWDGMRDALIVAATGRTSAEIKIALEQTQAVLDPSQAMPHPAKLSTAEQFPDEPAPEPKKATRAKPSATKARPLPEAEPEEATPLDMPPLEVLKQAVTVAVRAAQKNGGPKKILELLPGFKTETGLDFVMNSQEIHRPALYNLVRSAGLDA